MIEFIRMDKRNNCFSLLRCIIALRIVYGHALVSEMNVPWDIKLINWIDAVPLFFFISGYSIMMSLSNKKVSIKEYGIRRFIRLFPELWLSLLLEIVLLIAQFPSLLKEKQFYLWVFGQSTLFQFWTPDCLRFYGNGTPNGSLWTIVVFIQFYILIYYLYPKIAKLDIKKDIVILILFIGINSALSFLEGNIGDIAFKLVLETILPYLYMFYFGIIFYKYSDKLIELCKKYFWTIFLLFLLASKFNYITNFIPHTYNTQCVIHILITCIFFFAIAYRFPNLKLKNDYSYGIYVYHMVVMNYFVQNKIISNDHICLLVIYIITISLAILSSKITKQIIRKLKVA